MADENPNPAPANNDSSPATGAVPSSGQGGNPPTSGTDPVQMAQELGRLKKIEEDYKKYVSEVDPVIQTLYSDQELFQKVGDVHRKRMGISPDNNPKPDPTPQSTPQVAPESKDTRSYLVSQVVKDFYAKHGIDKLDPDKRSEIDQNISMVLRENLNPTGGKTLAQIFDDVPLDKLPDHLDKAFYWATRAEREASLKEEGKREAMYGATGMIGSMPSSSTTSDSEVTLTAKELETCRKAGWDPAKYLENKKESLKRSNQLQ